MIKTMTEKESKKTLLKILKDQISQTRYHNITLDITMKRHDYTQEEIGRTLTINLY